MQHQITKINMSSKQYLNIQPQNKQVDSTLIGQFNVDGYVYENSVDCTKKNIQMKAKVSNNLVINKICQSKLTLFNGNNQNKKKLSNSDDDNTSSKKEQSNSLLNNRNLQFIDKQQHSCHEHKQEKHFFKQDNISPNKLTVKIQQPKTQNTFKVNSFQENKTIIKLKKQLSLQLQTKQQNVVQNIFKNEYTKMYNNFIHVYREQQQQNFQNKLKYSKQFKQSNPCRRGYFNNQKYFLSWILNMQLKNNKEFNGQIDKKKSTINKNRSFKINSNAKNNINCLKNIKQEKNNQSKQITQYYEYQPNTFKLIPLKTFLKCNNNVIYNININKWIAKQYINQMIKENYYINKIYGNIEVAITNKKKQKQMLKVEEDYLKYRELNQKYIQHLLNNNKESSQNTKEQGKESTQRQNKIQQQVYQISMNIFGNWILQELAKENNSENQQRESMKHFKMKMNLAIGNKPIGNIYQLENETTDESLKKLCKKIQMKMILLISSVEVKIKNEWSKFQEQQKNQATLCIVNLYKQLQKKENQHQPENKTQYDNVHQQLTKTIKQQFSDIFTSYFISGKDIHLLVAQQSPQHSFEHLQTQSSPCTTPYTFTPLQLQNYLNYYSNLQSNMEQQQTNLLSNKITGKMIYQAQDKIDQMRNKKQCMLKFAYTIIVNKKNIQVIFLQKQKESKEKNHLKRGISKITDDLSLMIKNRNRQLNNCSNKMKYDNINIKKRQENDAISSVYENSKNNFEKYKQQIQMIKKIKVPQSEELDKNQKHYQHDSKDCNYHQSNLFGNNRKKNDQYLTHSIHKNNIFIDKLNITDLGRKNNPYYHIQFLNNNIGKVMNQKNSNIRDFDINISMYRKSKYKPTITAYHNIKKNMDLNNIQIQGVVNKPETLCKNQNNPKVIKYNKYPIQFSHTIHFNSQLFHDTTIVYPIQHVHIKELTLRFLRDRRKYTINKVKILVPIGTMKINRSDGNSNNSNQQGERNSNINIINKVMRTMQVLSCLGATVIIQEEKAYLLPPQIQNITVQLLAFILGQNIQKVWQNYTKMNKNKQQGTLDKY